MFHRILMCRPTYFKVAYEINPWMRITVQANNQTAHVQWENLRRTLDEKCGARIELVEPRDGLPDMVFTANAGIIRKNQIYLSNFKYAERRGERQHFQRWFDEHGFRVYGDDECSFEGAGDALFAGDKLFAAHGFRTDARVYNMIFQKLHLEEIPARSTKTSMQNEAPKLQIQQEKQQQMVANVRGGSTPISTPTTVENKPDEVHLIMCELVDPRFYHIDTCFCPVTPDLAIWFPNAFSEDSRKRMENEIELIAVPEEEAKNFACNSVVVGRRVVVPAKSEQTQRALEKRGFETHAVDVSEFLKAGGACKCLTLSLSG